LCFVISPPAIILADVQGLKIYAESKSVLGIIFAVKGSYEEETTHLFSEVVKEGMTVLDIGANIGYYSLLAGRQVGKLGKVFAFEPWKESFALLEKNIDVNGFKNIKPIAKAVSHQCGRQRLFLGNDPLVHSLSARAGKDYIEVDVTTVDEFVCEENISVDLIKVDVEGLEMEVLEGMADTICKNPSLKLIVEFAPLQLMRSGCSPIVFLEKLRSFGFKIYDLDDEKHTRELVRPNETDGFLKSVHTRHPILANLYCDRGAAGAA
jgi:FkbM family methyltransferase